MKGQGIIPATPEELLSLRKDYGLSYEDVARLLLIDTHLYPRWEKGEGDCPYGVTHIVNKFTAYARLVSERTENLILKKWPLKTVRYMLRMNIYEMARKYATTPNTWKKYEANHRLLPHTMLCALERDVLVCLQEVVNLSTAPEVKS